MTETEPHPVGRGADVGIRVPHGGRAVGPARQSASNRGSNAVNSHPTAAEEPNGTMTQVLRYLAEDIAAHPERAKVVDAALVERLRGFTEGVEVDVDGELSPDDE
jgi:hypothetical protein